jgi:hypothetical protein
MSETESPRRILRRIGAVMAGFFVTVVLSLGTDVVLHATGVFPGWGQPMSDPLFLFATVYRTIYTIAAGYITARLAPDQPMTHVLILGLVGTAAGLAGVVATWNAGPELGPRWYPISLAVLALPSVWLGGKLNKT